jgi:hypothetical protein
MAENKTPKMPCYLRAAITPNPNFVERSEILDQIDIKLLPSDAETTASAPGLRSFALCGFGGLGKTQIATHYAFAREKNFDAIFWIQADEVGKLYKSFQDIAKALGLVDEGDQSDMVVSRDKVLRWLSNPRKQQPAAADPAGETNFTKWLMVFDNADNIDLMTEFWPSTSYGSILVTSRDPLAKTDLATQGIDLPPMTGNECALLLQKEVDEPASPEGYQAALDLVTRLGDVPLAVSQIATQIRRKHMTIKEYLSLHCESSTRSMRCRPRSSTTSPWPPSGASRTSGRRRWV